MKKILSFLCSFAFALSGVMLAITASESSSDSYKTMNAATLQRPVLSFPTTFPATSVLPQDLLLDLAKQQGLSVIDKTTIDANSALIDSLNTKIAMLERKGQVTKVKWRKVPVPTPIAPDTIKVPVYYLATQVGNKEGPTGECISVYEVHKVDEICSEMTISSVEGTNEYHIRGSD